MHHPPGFKPPGVSSKMRFQSTAQMAMHDTASKYDGLETPAERKANLRQRKLNNTTTNIAFGSHPTNYETNMRANDNYDRTVVDVAAGAGDGAGLTPYELKQKLATANWDFGDGTSSKVNSYALASTLKDPTGPAFLGYKGTLNDGVRAAIRTSSLHLGSHDDGTQYDTTSRTTMALAANDIDYAGDKRRAAAMKKTLVSSSVNLSSDEVRGPEDYISTGHISMAYDPVGARTASGQMDPKMQADLRAHHFSLGYGGGGPPTESTEKERQRKAAEAVDQRRREIIQAKGDAMHPDLVMMAEDKARVRELKRVLLQNSITIGDDPDYL